MAQVSLVSQVYYCQVEGEITSIGGQSRSCRFGLEGAFYDPAFDLDERPWEASLILPATSKTGPDLLNKVTF